MNNNVETIALICILVIFACFGIALIINPSIFTFIQIKVLKIFGIIAESKENNTIGRVIGVVMLFIIIVASYNMFIK